MSKGSILVVEDDSAWNQLVVTWVEGAGYTEVQSAESGEEALEKAMVRPPDCVILDIVLPDISGIDVCRKLRSIPNLSRVPIILLTAHKKEKVLGLQSGADYFVGKTGEPMELLATLDALFRRREMDTGVIRRGQLVLRLQERQVHYEDKLVSTLTPKMFNLLYGLAQRSPEPVSRNELYKMLDGGEEPDLSRALDVLLNRLKKALPEELSTRITNVKNYGYVYLPNEKA